MDSAASLIPFHTAVVSIKRLRDEVCCSEPWVDALVSPSANPDFWILRSERYPPGSRDTLMRECPTCKRICPPLENGERLCSDCEAELVEERYEHWVSDPSRKGLRPILDRLHRINAIRYDEFMAWPTSGVLGPLNIEQRTDVFTEAEEGPALYLEEMQGGPLTSDDVL